MHILVVNSEYPPIGGGASNASAHIAKSLVKLGQKVTVLTARYRDLPRREEIEGITVIRLPALRGKADRSSTSEQISFMLSASLFGLRWVDHLKPDMALAFFGAPSGVATWFWSHFFTLPYIVSLRGGDVPGFRPYDFARQHRILAPLLRRVWRRAAAVVANSAGLRKLGQAFEAKVPVLEIPNGVDLEKFQIGDRDWKSPRLLFVGRIVYQKGIDLLLLALAELREMPWSLQIVGDGPSLEEFRNQAKELGITNRVSFSGWQSRQDLPNTYRNANLFVNPSRHEGMPNTVLEAMSSGLPVLASRISGNEELVTEETGVLFPPEDSLALQNALRELLPNAELREKMGAAARKRVEAQYSWDKVAEAYLNLMNSSMELR